MEYNKFLNKYYDKMFEIFNENIDFRPHIEFNLGNKEAYTIPNKYLEENTNGSHFLGLAKIKSGSPASAYETYFEVMYMSYPEFYMLFLPKENMMSLADSLNNEEDIEHYLTAVYLTFLNAKFIIKYE